jgi:hypothetical protein
MYYESPSQDTMKDLFYNQIRRSTKRVCGNESFDIQFSDSWI